MEQPRLDADAANFRLMIITSFLVGATMILFSSNVLLIKQSAAPGLGMAEGLLAVSIALMLFSSLVMLFMCGIILVSMYLGDFTLGEKLRRIAWARTLLGLSSILIPTSFGSMFLLSLGLSSRSWVLGGIGYGSGVLQALLRGYYLRKFVHPNLRQAVRSWRPTHGCISPPSGSLM